MNPEAHNLFLYFDKIFTNKYGFSTNILRVLAVDKKGNIL